MRCTYNPHLHHHGISAEYGTCAFLHEPIPAAPDAAIRRRNADAATDTAAEVRHWRKVIRAARRAGDARSERTAHAALRSLTR